MVSTIVSATEIEEAAPARRPWPLRDTWFWGVVLGSHVPFLVLHLWNLWRFRPHYEFFPLVLAAAAWLIWRRWPRGAAERTRLTRMLGTLLLLLGFGMLAGAVLLYSPWLGAIAAMLSLGGVLLALKGRAAWRELTGPWLLLWLVIPPPMGLDDELIRMFQDVTARTASGLLELLHVDHLLAGHVFRLPDRELFVAEACSGVHSQLVLVAIGVVLAVLWRRSLLHTAFLVAASVFCAVTVNTSSVLLIVLAAARWGVDLSVGWQYEVLGYSLVGLGLLLLLSADQLLVGLLAPILNRWNDDPDSEFEPETDAVPAAVDPLSRVWNRLVASYPFTKPPRPEATLQAAPPDQPASLWKRIAVAVSFGCLGVLPVVVELAPSRHAPEIHTEQLEAAFQKTWLPARVGSWEQKDYRTEERDLASDAGRFSRKWVFQSDDRIASVSVDFPFLGWHELTLCYEGQGWREVSREVRAEHETGPYVAVQLSRDGGEAGYLLFSLFDGTAQPVQPGTTHWIGLRGKLARSPVWALLGSGDGAASPTQTTVQIQQFIAGGEPLDRRQREAAEQMYLDFRRRLVSRWQTDAAER